MPAAELLGWMHKTCERNSVPVIIPHPTRPTALLCASYRWEPHPAYTDDAYARALTALVACHRAYKLAAATL